MRATLAAALDRLYGSCRRIRCIFTNMAVSCAWVRKGEEKWSFYFQTFVTPHVVLYDDDHGKVC